MFIIISIVSACILIPLGVLLLWSYPGKPKPILDGSGRPLAGSLSEKIFVDINGVKQGMVIQSKDETNPVLLFLHGGPGMPEYFLTEHYPTGLEDDFTVTWWDQRGAGLSYSGEITPEMMTYGQLISDTLEVTKYLRHRFGKEKIYLMAHSGGTFLGIQVAARTPELYYAYIGLAQVSYQLESEKRAYDYALAQYKKNGNTNMLRKLEAAPPAMTVPLPAAYDALRDSYMHDLGIGTTRNMKSVVTGVFVPSWQSREYTLPEKVNLWRGKFFSMSMLRDKAFSTDLTQQVTELDIPVYFFSGIYDYTVNYTLAKDYFEKLRAPIKGFYTFEHSAHSPMFEEPERVRQILLEDVLTGTNSLADKK
jgi:pimeloyl-ACP methyl ester carboxylesterase